MTDSVARPVRQVAQSEGTILEKTQLLMVLVTVLALIASALAIANLVTAGVMERSSEIGLMKAVGAKDKQIIALFLTETIIVGLAGGVLGYGGGLALAQAIGYMVFHSSIAFAPVVVGLVAVLVILVVLGASIPASATCCASTRPKSCTEGDAYVQTRNVLADGHLLHPAPPLPRPHRDSRRRHRRDDPVRPRHYRGGCARADVAAEIRSYGANLVVRPPVTGSSRTRPWTPRPPRCPRALWSDPPRLIMRPSPSTTSLRRGRGRPGCRARHEPVLVVDGEWPEASGQVLVGEQVASTIDVKAGDTIRISQLDARHLVEGRRAVRGAGLGPQGRSEDRYPDRVRHPQDRRQRRRLRVHVHLGHECADRDQRHRVTRRVLDRPGRRTAQRRCGRDERCKP